MAMITLSRSVGNDWLSVLRDLGPAFAARAAAHDAEDAFVADNYRELNEHKLFSAGVPAEFGGGNATHAELADLLRETARHCGSTALALSMHTHLVATTVWRHRQGHPVEQLLRQIAADQLVLVTTGASDWLDSSGTAEPVDGGYRVKGRKLFGSGSPRGDLLVTSAVLEDPHAGPTVLHFAVPMQAPGVVVQDNWRALGMRATGSNDVVLDNVFVPEGAISLRRAKGKWHPFFSAVATIAMPLVTSVYLGIAEAARDLALQHVQRKRDDPDLWYLVGEMENALTTGQLATQAMIDLCANYAFTPDVATASAIFVRKTIAAQALLAAVEKSLEVVGGGGLFRAMGLERLLRDIHAAQFHPLRAKRQQRFTGRVALGLEPIG
jgi:alkylation response protein AidB-like acyl-CoA dehydrogenase